MYGCHHYLYGTTWSYGLLVVLVAWIACVAIRYVFLQASIFVIRLLDRSEKQRTLRTTHRGRVVSTMAGLRGGVSLAVACPWRWRCPSRRVLNTATS